jgi:hypothetical protein
MAQDEPPGLRERDRVHAARRLAGGTVSSKRNAISASVAAPNTATPSSVARQPNRSDSRPPSGALAQAITPRPLRPLDMARAASTG